MAGVTEQLTSANDALRGCPDLRLWLIARIGASICTTSCYTRNMKELQMSRFKHEIMLMLH